MKKLWDLTDKEYEAGLAETLKTAGTNPGLIKKWLQEINCRLSGRQCLRFDTLIGEIDKGIKRTQKEFDVSPYENYKIYDRQREHYLF